MNSIAAVRMPSKFVPEPHLVMTVDGQPLDMILDAVHSNLAGFVSALLGWFHNEEDEIIPWQRILPPVGCAGYAPLLICPDDLDYTCTVIMAEVVAEEDVIRWDRLGYDATPPGVVGSCIRWNPAFGSYLFPREEYERCLQAFKSK